MSTIYKNLNLELDLYIQYHINVTCWVLHFYKASHQKIPRGIINKLNNSTVVLCFSKLKIKDYLKGAFLVTVFYLYNASGGRVIC